jgi:N-acetylmuramoyl-L-alanine amidase
MKLIIHHSASTFGNAAQIQAWHTHPSINYSRIGYHYVILNGCIKKDTYHSHLDGLLETGRDESEKGAHCRGHNNDLGICLIGGALTDNQLNTLISFIIDRSDVITEIKQHSDYDKKKPHCAGLTKDFMHMLNVLLK